MQIAKATTVKREKRRVAPEKRKPPLPPREDRCRSPNPDDAAVCPLALTCRVPRTLNQARDTPAPWAASRCPHRHSKAYSSAMTAASRAKSPTVEPVPTRRPASPVALWIGGDVCVVTALVMVAVLLVRPPVEPPVPAATDEEAATTAPVVVSAAPSLVTGAAGLPEPGTPEPLALAGGGEPAPPDGEPEPPDGEPAPPEGDEPEPPDGEPAPPDGEPVLPEGEPAPPVGAGPPWMVTPPGDAGVPEPAAGVAGPPGMTGPGPRGGKSPTGADWVAGAVAAEPAGAEPVGAAELEAAGPVGAGPAGAEPAGLVGAGPTGTTGPEAPGAPPAGLAGAVPTGTTGPDAPGAVPRGAEAGLMGYGVPRTPAGPGVGPAAEGAVRQYSGMKVDVTVTVTASRAAQMSAGPLLPLQVFGCRYARKGVTHPQGCQPRRRGRHE